MAWKVNAEPWQAVYIVPHPNQALVYIFVCFRNSLFLNPKAYFLKLIQIAPSHAHSLLWIVDLIRSPSTSSGLLRMASEDVLWHQTPECFQLKSLGLTLLYSRIVIMSPCEFNCTATCQISQGCVSLRCFHFSTSKCYKWLLLIIADDTTVLSLHVQKLEVIKWPEAPFTNLD